MRDKYKIKITYGRYENEYKIALLVEIKLLIFPNFWWPEVTQRGSLATIRYYRNLWKRDFELTNNDIEDKTGKL